MTHDSARRPTAARLASAWPVWGPMLLLLAYTVPFIPFLLPSITDHLGEVYQPLQALKFFATRGTAFHKYGPAPNFVLAPVYAGTLGYWYATGSLSKPSDDFPYGFSDPLGQLGILILEHRLVFLSLGLCALGFLGSRLRLITQDRWACALAMIFCVATNYPLISSIPTGKPDSAMLEFLAAALAVYLTIIYKGLTPARGFWLSAFAVLSISSKEIAAFVFVPTYLGLGWAGWRAARNSPDGMAIFWKSTVVALATGVLGYALLNIIYAPGVWWQRMQFWLMGPGISPGVWGKRTFFQQMQRHTADLMTNLGPGGTISLVVALVAAIVGRVRHRILLLLPSVGALSGAIQVRYGGERFLTPVALCLSIVVAAGLGELLSWQRRAGSRAMTISALLILVAANMLFACWSWVELFSTPEYRLEQYAQSHIARNRKLTQFSLWQTAPGSARLERFGYSYEHRPYHEWSADPSGMPDVLFCNKAALSFLTAITKHPERGEMMKNESNFDFSSFRTPQQLGYELATEIVPEVPPWWFPTAWLPWAGEQVIYRNRMLVFIRPRTATTPVAAESMNTERRVSSSAR